MATVVLVGGSRDGESTVLDDQDRRLLAASEAPGLIDVYEPTGETRHLAGNDEPVAVFAFVGQEPVGDLSPQSLRMPDHGPDRG
jgi:hypothetical protein